MSFRKLRVLIQGLPPESATMTALRNANPGDLSTDVDATQGQWSQDNMLRALLIDEVRILRWVFQSVNSEKGKAPEQPAPLPRPGVSGEKARPRLSTAQTEFLFRHINGLPQEPTVNLQPLGM
jgi:hypothetical protein